MLTDIRHVNVKNISIIAVYFKLYTDEMKPSIRKKILQSAFTGSFTFASLYLSGCSGCSSVENSLGVTFHLSEATVSALNAKKDLRTSPKRNLSTSIGGNRYSLTPDNYTIYIKGIYLVRCEDSTGTKVACASGTLGDGLTITRTAIYEGGIPVTITSAGSSFNEAINLDSLSGIYNGIQLKLGYIQQRFPTPTTAATPEVVANLMGRAYRICTSPSADDLCDDSVSTTHAERGDYLIEQSGRGGIYEYLYYTGCTGSPPTGSATTGTTECTGFSTTSDRPTGYGIYDPHFTDMNIGGTNEWIDGYWSPLSTMTDVDSSTISGQSLAISFDIADSFEFHDNAMSASTCTVYDSTKYNCTFVGGDPNTSATDAGNLNAGMYDLLDDNAFLPNVPTVSASISTTAATTSASTSGVHERVFVGTGEYDSGDDWSAVLRFDEAEAISCPTTLTAVAAAGTFDVKSIRDSTGVRLNFVHSTFVDETTDEMYMASLFTTSDNHNCSGTTEVCGSIGIITGASSYTGAQTLSRHLFGSSTQINQPHGIWVDTRNNMLFAANTMSDNILVWDNASTVDGNTAPNRVITTANQCQPVHVFVDADHDRMFVACKTSTLVGMGLSGPPSIWIYDNAKTLSGLGVPTIKIEGTNTRISEGNNQTTHNIWYDTSNSILIVGHHTNEVLIYDLTTLNWSPTTMPDTQDLTPRVLKINEQADDSDQYNWSAYGLFYLPSLDRLYVSAGYGPGTSSGASGPPTAGTPQNAVKVYDGISASTFSGMVTPTTEIWWSSGDQYYPPQALWVTLY